MNYFGCCRYFDTFVTVVNVHVRMVIHPHIVVTMCVIVPFLMTVISGCIQFGTR